MLLDQRYKTHNPKIISETIDGETIIINLDSGHYFSLNQTGGEIWNGILSRLSTHEIVRGLATAYPMEENAISSWVGEFLDNLRKEGLIAPTDNFTQMPGLPSQPKPAKSLSFEKPSFQKYEDMQDLLLLDPIHDVDESGWPKTTQIS